MNRAAKQRQRDERAERAARPSPIPPPEGLVSFRLPQEEALPLARASILGCWSDLPPDFADGLTLGAPEAVLVPAWHVTARAACRWSGERGRVMPGNEDLTAWDGREGAFEERISEVISAVAFERSPPLSFRPPADGAVVPLSEPALEGLVALEATVGEEAARADATRTLELRAKGRAESECADWATETHRGVAASVALEEMSARLLLLPAWRIPYDWRGRPYLAWVLADGSTLPDGKTPAARWATRPDRREIARAAGGVPDAPAEIPWRRRTDKGPVAYSLAFATVGGGFVVLVLLVIRPLWTLGALAVAAGIWAARRWARRAS